MRHPSSSLKFLSILLALAALLLLVFAWRLSLGPVAFDWAGPYLKQALARDNKDFDYDFRDVVLTWRSASDKYYDMSGLEVRFLDLSLKDKASGLALNIPEAGIQFSALGLLRGILAPVSAEFSSLSFQLVLPRDIWDSREGIPFDLRLRRLLEEFQNSPRLLPRLTRQLLSAPDPMSSAGYLKELIFRDTHIAIMDELSGSSWEIPNAVLDMKRAEDGLVAILEGDMLRGEDQDLTIEDLTSLHVSLAHSNRRKDGIIQLRFSNFNPAKFSADIDGLRDLQAQDAPLNGIIDVEITSDLSLANLVFELEGGPGRINPGNLYERPVPLHQAMISGYYAGVQETLFIDQFSLVLQQIRLRGDGLLFGDPTRPGIVLDATVTDMPFSQLKTYWPAGMAEGARSWIDRNISAGRVPEGRLEVNLRPEMWDQDALPENAFTFAFTFDGLDAHYLRPMPVIGDAAGRATLNMSRFSLDVDQGAIEDVLVREARLLFSDIDKKGGTRAHIEVPLVGRLESVLRIIDHEPLGYPGKYGIAPGSVTGMADTLVTLNFPLVRDLSLKDVGFKVEAAVKDLAIPALSDSLALAEGDIDLLVTEDSLDARGSIMLNGVNFDARWHESFTPAEDDFPTLYQIEGKLEGEDWDRFSLPFEPFIEGPAGIRLTLFGRGAQLVRGEGEIDLGGTRTTFSPLGWVKGPDQPARASFDMIFDPNDILRLENITLASDSLRARAEMLLVGDRTVRFAVPELVMTDTGLAFEMIWNAEKQNYRARLDADRFDVTPILDIMTSSEPSEGGAGLPDFDLTGRFEQVKARNGVVLDRARLVARYEQKDFRDVGFTAAWGEDKTVEVTLKPGPEDRILSVSGNDAGEALRGFGVFNLGVGGDIDLKSDFIRHDDGISIGGKVKARNFKVIESPGFSRLLAEENFAKAREELKKDGLKFDEFEMKFRQYNGILEISEGRAKGNMLGLTMSGSVDQSYNEVSLNGTIVPAYGLNSFLGNIPLVGAILTGGKDQGVFAATYRMSGTMDDVKIDVNPLAALAPGILRNIFKVFEGGQKKSLREQAEELQQISPDVKAQEEKQEQTPEPKLESEQNPE